MGTDGEVAITAGALADSPGEATPDDPAGNAEHPETASRSAMTPATEDLTRRF